jgi:hypothetical protein
MRSVASAAASSATKQAAAVCIGLSALVATYAPSSLAGVISPGLAVAQLAIIMIVAAALGLLYRFGRDGIALSAGMFAILLFATATSPIPDLAPGAAAPYLALGTVLAVRCEPRATAMWAVRLFELLSATLQLLAMLVVLGVSAALEVNAQLYQAFYPELFEQMVEWYGKPVTVFATHSIAGLMYFAFLATHVRLVASARSRLSRVIGAASIAVYLVLLALLLSNTSFLLFAAAIAFIVRNFFPRRRLVAYVLAACMLIGLGAIGLRLIGDVDSVFGLLRETFGSSEGGFLGRYSAGGRLQQTYDYLADHPLRPIGFTYHPGVISLGDNFIAEYVVRGTVLLYGLLLVALWRFLRENLLTRADAVALFVFFFAADLGYPLLTYGRALGVLFLFVAVWNHTAQGCESRDRPLASTPVGPSNRERGGPAKL